MKETTKEEVINPSSEEEKYEWNPWMTFHREMSNNLPIPEPPCRHCRFWSPIIMFGHKYGEYMGIRCCASDNMHRDFSCFESKESMYVE